MIYFCFFGSTVQNTARANRMTSERIMTSLTTSIKHFTHLNLAPGPTWTDTTKRKAPHKPLLLLLLAVLDLLHRGVITSRSY